MQIGRGWGMPDWVTVHIAVCSNCKRADGLIIELHDSRGTYYHCMYCNTDLDSIEKVQ